MVAVDVGELARKLVLAAPAAGAGTELRQRQGEWREPSIARGKRDIGAGGAEPDNVRRTVAVDVGELAREMVLAAPAAGAGSEGGKLERGRCKDRSVVDIDLELG